jgi:hypothetical protein
MFSYGNNKPLLVVDNIKTFYTKISKDKDGWISFLIYCPILFELVEIKTIEKTIFKAWYNGRAWEGYRFKKQIPVIKWRRIKER